TAVYTKNMRLVKKFMARQFKNQTTDSVIYACYLAMQKAQGHKIKIKFPYFYNRIGTAYEKQNKFDSALFYFKKTTDSGYAAKNSKEYLTALNHIGAFHFSQGNYNKALDEFLKFLKVSGEVHDSSNIEGGLVNIGNVYLDLKKPRIALDYYKKALLFLDTLDKCKTAAREVAIGNAFSDIRFYEKIAGYSDSAYLYYSRALLKSKSCKNDEIYSVILSDMSNVYHDKGNYAKSIETLLETIQIKLNKGYPNIGTDYVNLAGNYLSIKEFKKAKETFLKVLKVDDVIGLDNYSLAYKGLGTACKKLGEFKEAAHYLELYGLYKDSLYQESSSEKRKELEMNFEFDKKEALTKAENDKQKVIALAEARKQKLIIWWVCGVLGLMTIFSYFIFKGLKQQREANQIISKQKHEVEKQKELVEEKQKEIIDSINYAKRIQNSLLANKDFVNRNTRENFILFKPKDIVSGDFYWATRATNSKKEELFYLACCDSTGHGVPGAFMSLLNIGFLSEAINEKDITEPNAIFNYVRQRLIESISKEEQKDGFDGILLCINKTSGQITYAAANNNPLLISGNSLTVLKSDKMPVGKGEKTNPFSLFQIEVKPDSVLYLFTDGYPDQFGGPKGKKFKYKPLEELLLANFHLSLQDQAHLLEQVFSDWRGSLEQVDDVLMMGVKL
ncbi:MAG: protein serine/threonine phosphatase, partial [Bacteroidetes bacterium]|nr:protein serine/threonine phosphatase [Bacteroidota bacterium]